MKGSAIMFNLKKHNKLNLIRFWSISYSIVLLFPVIVSFIIYSNILKTLYLSIDETSLIALENASSSVDVALNSIIRSQTTLSSDRKLFTLAKEDSSITLRRNFGYTSENELFSSMDISSQYIVAKYVYIPKKNIIYTGTSIMEPHHLYLTQYPSYKNLPESEWTKKVLECTFSSFINIQSAEKNNIFYVYPVYESGSNSVLYTLIAEINFDALFSDVAGKYSNCFFMSSTDKNILYTNLDAQAINAVNNVIFSSQHFNHTKVNKEEYIVLKTNSNNGNWSYGFSIPKKEYYAPIRASASFSLWVYMVMLILGFLLVFYIVYMNFAPVKNILSVLKEDDEDDEDAESENSNIYDFLNKKITHIMDDKNTYINKLNTQTSIFRNTILSNILTGKNNASISPGQQLELLGISMNSSMFCTIAVHYGDLDEMFHGDKFLLTQPEKEEYAKFIISNICTEIFREHYDATDIFLDGCNIFLAKIFSPEISDFKSEFRIIADNLSSLIDNEFGFKVFVTVSSIHFSTSTISDSYTEVMLAMQYALSSKKYVAFYDEIPEENFRKGSVYIDFEDEMIAYLDAKDYKNCKKLVYTCLYKFQTQDNISPDMVRSFCYDLLTTFFKHIISKTDDKSREFIAKIEMNSVLDKGISSSNMILKTMSILDRYFLMLDEETEKYQPQKSSFYNNIKSYIEEHYSEQGLFLNEIAEYFGINPSYLSTQFKKEFNIGVTDYISLVRIENAKKLLVTTKLTNEQISAQVGFANARTFLRTFQRLEGVTPKEYRKLNTPIL